MRSFHYRLKILIVVSSTITGCADPSVNHSIPDCCASGALCCGAIDVFTQTTLTFSGATGSSSSYTIAGNTYHYPNDGGAPTTFTIADTVLTLSQQQTASNGGCLIVTTLLRN